MKKYFFFILCISTLASAYITTGLEPYTYLELQIANNFAKKGIIIDYSKNPELYRLNENITRSELMAIALKIKGVKLPDEFVCQGKYADVTDNNWICRTVELSLDNQLIRSPSSDKNTARPLDVVTRAEALAILLKANGLNYSKNIARGSNPASMPQWQIDVMEGAVTLKIIPSTQ